MEESENDFVSPPSPGGSGSRSGTDPPARAFLRPPGSAVPPSPVYGGGGGRRGCGVAMNSGGGLPPPSAAASSASSSLAAAAAVVAVAPPGLDFSKNLCMEQTPPDSVREVFFLYHQHP